MKVDISINKPCWQSAYND